MLSAHYAAAAILHDRDLSLDQFAPERYAAPALVRFAAERVSVVPDPTLSGAAATVEVRRSVATSVTARCTHTKGSPENPLTTAQVEAKFRRYAAPRLSAAPADFVVRAVTQLERLG